MEGSFEYLKIINTSIPFGIFKVQLSTYFHDFPCNITYILDLIKFNFNQYLFFFVNIRILKYINFGNFFISKYYWWPRIQLYCILLPVMLVIIVVIIVIMLPTSSPSLCNLCYLDQKSGSFFSQGPHSKYVRLCEPRSFCHNDSALLSQCKGSHRQYKNDYIIIVYEYIIYVYIHICVLYACIYTHMYCPHSNSRINQT